MKKIVVLFAFILSGTGPSASAAGTETSIHPLTANDIACAGVEVAKVTFYSISLIAGVASIGKVLYHDYLDWKQKNELAQKEGKPLISFKRYLLGLPSYTLAIGTLWGLFFYYYWPLDQQTT